MHPHTHTYTRNQNTHDDFTHLDRRGNLRVLQEQKQRRTATMWWLIQAHLLLSPLLLLFLLLLSSSFAWLLQLLLSLLLLLLLLLFVPDVAFFAGVLMTFPCQKFGALFPDARENQSVFVVYCRLHQIISLAFFCSVSFSSLSFSFVGPSYGVGGYTPLGNETMKLGGASLRWDQVYIETIQ